MAGGADLSRFWDLIETNFPLAGSRSELGSRLGLQVVAALEAAGILSFLRIADAVPCPHPGGAGCPRQVISHRDGSYSAVCGNDPPECADIDLKKDQVEFLGIAPERLCQALRSPLSAGGQVEEMADLRHVYRVGAFKPDPATRHAVYLVVRCGDREYAEAIDALRSRHAEAGAGFAVLVPTDRFVPSNAIRQMATLGVPIVPLQGTINIEAGGRLLASVKPERLFMGIARKVVATAPLSNPIIAQVLTHEGWKDLDDRGYARVIETISNYDIVADEATRSIWKRADGKKRHQRKDRVLPSYFRMIRAAVETRGYFDPATMGPAEELMSGKQIFQRARQAVDIKQGSEDGPANWRLFKTAIDDKHATYRFQPDPDSRFALIFLPRS